MVVVSAVIWDFKKDYLNTQYIVLQNFWNTSFSLKLAIVFLVELGVITFLSMTKVELFPDLFSINGIENKNSYFDLIVGSLSSLSGILIAVFLIVFEILRQKLGESANDHFFKNRKLMFVLFLFVVTITTAFISKFIHNSLPQNNVNNLMYLNAILFMLSIITIIPSSLSILLSLKYEKVIKNLVEKITFDEIMEISHTMPYLVELSDSQSIENLPFNKLKNIAKKNMNNEVSISKLIVKELTHKLSREIDNNIDNNGYNKKRLSTHQLNFFIPYFELLTKDLLKEALKNNDIEFVKMINHNMYSLLNECINTKININDFREEIKKLDEYQKELVEEALKKNDIEFIKDIDKGLYTLLRKCITTKVNLKDLTEAIEILDEYQKRLIEFNNINVFIKFKYQVEKIIINALKNAPAEIHLSSLYSTYEEINIPPNNYEEESKWGVITDNLIEIPLNGLEYSLGSNYIEFFSYYSMSISSIIYKISRLDTLGSMQKNYLMWCLKSKQISLTLDSLKQNKDETFVTHIFDSSFMIDNLIEDDTLLERYLKAMGNFMIELLKIKRLDLLCLMRFGVYGNRLIKAYSKSPTITNGFEYVLKTLIYIKKELSKDVINNRQEYSEIQVRIRSYANEAKEPDLAERLRKIEKSFKRVPETDWINGDGYIKWDDKQKL